MEYHLRVSSTKQNSERVLNEFVSSFKIVAIVSAYEHKGIENDIVINPHCHSYIKYDVVPTKQAISAFFKKWKHLIIKPANETAGYSHIKQKKTKDENIIYTIKDGDIIKNTLGDLKEWQEKTKIINDSKSLSSRDKIYNKWIDINGYNLPKSKYELFKFIDRIYILDWNKSPLSMGHKICNSIYLLEKINQTYKDTETLEYNVLLKDLYNIKSNNQEFIELNNEKFYEKDEIILNKEKQITKLKNELDNDNRFDIMVEF